ncbi:MAG TPA: hypothetical protein VK395_03285 [Gemmataceae bacterium]|nr:hypothetical protein [Gemmataceae bacterium]
MDTESLVEKLIDDGEKLVERISLGGFPVTAAFWLRASENERWYFYIVSPLVDDEGLAQAYRRLHPFVWGVSEPLWIDPLEIKLIGPSNPIAQDVLAIHRRAPGSRVSPIRWGGKMLGNLSVEGAYLYPLPVTTP